MLLFKLFGLLFLLLAYLNSRGTNLINHAGIRTGTGIRGDGDGDKFDKSTGTGMETKGTVWGRGLI